MSKHDLKARQLQVEEIISPSAQPIRVGELLRYEAVQVYASPRDIPDIEKVQSLIGETAGSAINETNLDIIAQVALAINWQVDVDPEGDGSQTYADRHGNRRVRVFGLMNASGVFSNYSPNLNYTKDADGNITTVNVTDIFPGIITII